MGALDWNRVRDAFDEAREIAPAARAAFLADRYPTEVAEQALDLLGHHDAATAFLAPAPRTLVEGGFAEAVQAPLEREDLRGHVIAGRYALGDQLGQGGTATVYEAEDRVSGDTVAVKVGEPRLGAPVDLIRHEALALRLLRLPGVVEMRDSGRDGERSFLVMGRVEGRPFPGLEDRAPAPWATIRERTLALLEVLARVHWTGIAHCDLKPSNVLVDGEGAPVVLDLGIAQDPGGDEALRRMLALAGTPRYRAPEQLRGEPGTVASDLYAVGVMLYETLSGEDPQGASGAAELLSLRPHAPARPLLEVAPAVPPPVAAIVDALVAVDPRDRPASAADALGALQAASEGTLPEDALAVRIASLPGPPLAEDALATLFAGFERIHRIPSDAAAELHRRAAGDPRRVRRELAAWERAGLARVDGDRVHITRTDLERLRGGLLTGADAAEDDTQRDAAFHARRADELPVEEPLRLYHRLMSGDLARVAEEAVTIGDALYRAGRVGEAHAVASEGLAALRAHDDALDESPLLGLMLRVAMQTATTGAFDGVLYALGRSRGTGAERERFERLARAALLTLQGDMTRALALVPPIDDRLDTEAARVAVAIRMFAARHLEQERRRALVAEVLPLAEARGDEIMLRSIRSEQAWDAYARGDYAEAAALHRALADVARSPAARQTSLLNAASAALEADAFDEAVGLAVEARDLAMDRRHVVSVARAERVLRAAAYRRGDDLEPDTELVDAVGAVGSPALEALVALNEAAVAWRGGRLRDGRALAWRAAKQWRRVQQQDGEWLCTALAAACGRTLDDEQLARFAQDLEGCADDVIVAQAAHLAAQVPSSTRERFLALARARAARVAPAMHEACKEVLPLSAILK